MSERIFADERDWNDGAQRPHLFRYYMARGYLTQDDIVNDVACGCGYGSELMAEVAGQVTGLDYSPEMIDHANDFHVQRNKEFLRGSYTNLDYEVVDLNEAEALPPCTVSVSIETIEHLKDPLHFAKLLKESTKRLIFITTPIVPTKHANPFHLQDFTPNDIETLFTDEIWRPFHSYKQGAGPDSMYGGFIFWKDEQRRNL